ncbi:UNVERIFIED_CONTAM: hypothetical protein K2H54_064723, partial [Gekko kuhli]
MATQDWKSLATILETKDVKAFWMLVRPGRQADTVATISPARWRVHFAAMYQSSERPVDEKEINEVLISAPDWERVSPESILERLNQMKRGKVVGPDFIPLGLFLVNPE